MVSLLMNGAEEIFKELPPPNDEVAMRKVHNYVKSLK